MKKRLVMAAVLCAALAVSGCGNKNEVKETETTTETTSETESESADATEAESGSGAEAEETEAKPMPEYNALDYVTLGEYKGLEVTLAEIEVTDEEIDAEVQSALSTNNKYDVTTEGKVQDGDIVNIDYEGKKDDVAFDGGTATDYDLTIGSGSFIEGFEEGLIGKEIGSEVDLELTFPESYHSEDLAGADVVFHVKINGTKKLSEISDEIVADISEYSTVEEYRDSIKEMLMEEKKSTQENQKISDLVTQACKNATINGYPEEVVEYNLAYSQDYYKEYAEQSGMEFADFLQAYFQVTEEEFNTQMDAQIRQGLEQEMVLLAIADTEELTISDEEFDAGVAKFAEQYGVTSEEFLSQMDEKVLILSLKKEKAIDLIEENAIVHGDDAEDASEAETKDTSAEDTSEAESETETESETSTESETESETKSE